MRLAHAVMVIASTLDLPLRITTCSVRFAHAVVMLTRCQTFPLGARADTGVEAEAIGRGRGGAHFVLVGTACGHCFARGCTALVLILSFVRPACGTSRVTRAAGIVTWGTVHTLFCANEAFLGSRLELTSRAFDARSRL